MDMVKQPVIISIPLRIPGLEFIDQPLIRAELRM